MRRTIILLAAACALGLAIPVSAAPMRISHQGQLTDLAGTPITGPTDVRFTVLWGGTPSGAPGVAVYQEDITVTLDGNGVYHHLIGSGTPTSNCDEDRNGSEAEPCVLGAEDFPDDGTILYLELIVDPAGAANLLLPRQQIVSVPYALSAQQLGDDVNVDSSGNVGIGTMTPTQKLDVDVGDVLIQGPGSFDSGGDIATLYLGNTNFFVRGQFGAGVKIGSQGVPNAFFVQKTSGNVGIGKTNPQSRLAVNGLPTSPPDGSGTAGMLCITNDGNVWIDTTPASPCN